MLRALFTHNSSVRHLYLDDTSVTQKGVAEIMQGIAENLKIDELSFKNSNVEISSQQQPEWDIIIRSLAQNCSLTKLHL